MFEPLSIYLHVPFCSHICSYCAFNTYADMKALIPAYVDALIEEIQYTGQSNPGYSVHTINFGGGTPGLLTLAQYDRLLGALRAAYVLTPNCEISLEVNPNDLTDEYAHGLQRLGFNRVSIGMQASDEATLRLFERDHDTPAVARAIAHARDAGLRSVSLDLIFGAPTQSLASWRETMQVAIGFAVDHISTYGLVIEGGTPLEEWVAGGAVSSLNDDLAADMYDLSTTLLRAAGYEQYEISNWCRLGHESRHNVQYWQLRPYIGLGAGAHGIVGNTQTIVTRNPRRYIERLQRPESRPGFPATPASSKVVTIPQDELRADVIMMGMRLVRDGISRAEFRQRFGVDVVEINWDRVQRYVELQLLEYDDERIRLTERGRLVSNRIISDLI